jgi:hypothetical protein
MPAHQSVWCVTEMTGSSHSFVGARKVNKQQGQGELGRKPVQSLLELVISAIDEDVLAEMSVDFFWINVETAG